MTDWVIDHAMVEVTRFGATEPEYLPGGPGPLTHRVAQAKARYLIGDITVEQLERTIDEAIAERDNNTFLSETP